MAAEIFDHAPPPRVDLTRWPVVGRFLRWRHARTAMQLPLLAVAAVMVFDGLVGPQLAPKNLATVGVWLEYRGLVVLALLLAGNLFCMACPFMLPRQLARRLRERFLGGGHAVPARLANKWVALALVVAFFFVYELFDLWATPWWTAWVAVAYFAVAFLVDTFFRGAAFCKYVCPLGQFNFFGSLVSPLEVKVRDAGVCAACRTKDCIRGTAAPARAVPISLAATAPVAAPGVRGCELWLFQERKAGNQDCSFCLDCIHACPYDNVGVIGRLPLAELWHDRFRSGVGKFSQRNDLAALTIVFVFGAFLNAFAMIRPIYALQDAVRRALATALDAPGLALLFLLALGVIPAATLLAAGAVGRALGGRTDTLSSLVRRYVYSLVPVGFGMWLAHYQFHFLTGGLTVVPVIQSFLQDIGLRGSAPNWGIGQVAPDQVLFPVEAALLYLGATGSILVAFMIARSRHGEDRARVLGEALPWFVLILALLVVGLAILVQPMEMRGTLRMLGATG